MLRSTSYRSPYLLINVQYLCKMSDGKIKRPLDIPFVKWFSNCPLDFRVSTGSNGQVEFPSDICFFSLSINMSLNDVMTSIWTSCRYQAIKIAKRKCPLNPMDPVDLENKTYLARSEMLQSQMRKQDSNGQVMRAGISLEQLEVENKNYHLTIATNYIGQRL